MNGKLFAPIVILFFLPSLASAADYYVSPDGDGTNGLSWSTAWQTPGAIQWGSIGGGDTIYISGGSLPGSITYNEQLEVRASGTSDSDRIIITKGEVSGHDGEVIIHNTAGYTIDLDGNDHSDRLNYITIRNMTTTGSGIFVRKSTGIIIENMNIFNLDGRGINLNGWTTPDGFGNRERACRDIIIRNNHIKVPEGEDSGQQDGIYSQYNINTTIENNVINLSMWEINGYLAEPPHADTIQFVGDESNIIRNNWLQLHTNCSECQLIMEKMRGSTLVYNNVMIGSEGQSGQVFADKNDGSSGHVELYNNIIVSRFVDGPYVGCGGCPRTGRAVAAAKDDNLFRNNIIICYQGSEGACISRGSATYYDNIVGSFNPADSDYFTFDADYRPPSDSPAIDGGSGVELSSIFSTDIYGVSRPQGLAWDVGAYEYLGDIDCTSHSQCDILDDPPCIDYVCDIGGTDVCIATYTTTPCDDGNECTDPDTCDGAGSCSGTELTGTSCTDDIFCNGEETCQGGICQTGTPPCDDGYSCTTDCNEITNSCEITYDHSACNDGIGCTLDQCIGTGTDGCSHALDDTACLPLPSGCNSGSCDLTGCVYDPPGCSVRIFLPGEEIEAEDGEIEAPMGITDDGTDVYVHLTDPVEDDGWVNFTFNILQAGEYRLEARVNSHGSSGDNSFYVGLNSEPARNDDIYAYDTIQFNGFQWDNVSLRGGGDHLVAEHDPMNWTLSEGLHNFTFYGRESECWLDKIILLPLSSQSQTHHRADNNPPDCTISTPELLAFMQRWRVSIADVGMVEMMEAIEKWKLGNSCA